MGRRTFGTIWRRGKSYYIRYLVDGVRVKKAVGPSRKDAADALKAIASDLARERYLGVRPIAEATLGEVWRLVEPGRRARLAERWFGYHARHVKAAIDFFGEKAVKDLRREDVEDFVAHLRGKGCGASTVVRYLSSLRPVLAEAVDRGFSRQNPVALVKRPRVEIHEVPFVGESDIDRILAAAPADLRPLIAILADTGLRRGELFDLGWRDVDLGRRRVLVQRSKTGRGREVPLTARAVEAFSALRERRGPIPLRGEDPVLGDLLAPKRRRKIRVHAADADRRRAEQRLTIRFRRLAASLGMAGVTVHTLRHSCASRMVVAGVPLSFVARVTGHSTLTCAARYGRHAPTDAGQIAIRALEAAGANGAADARADVKAAARPGEHVQASSGDAPPASAAGSA
jgi:integrase